MPHPEFKPGFRFSAIDALILVAGALGAWIVSFRIGWLGFVIAFTVGHFFLFCNVFRIARFLELIWAAIFLFLTRFTVVSGRPGWTVTTLVSLGVTVLVVRAELRRPSYHGVGWRRFNPNLPQWWDVAVESQNEEA